MARIRTIKPTHWTDKKLAELSLPAHLLWIGIWNFSDDAGVIEADPLFIRSQVFPRRTDVRIEQVVQWLDQLVKARFLIPFDYENEGYYVSRTFSAHQKIDRPQPSKIPSDIIRRLIDECSTNVQPCIVKDSISKEEESNARPQNENPESERLKAENPAPQTGGAPPLANGPPFEEVHMYFQGAGGTEEMARKFWNKWEGLQWRYNSQPIVWRPFALNFLTNYHDNEKRHGKGNPANNQRTHGQSAGAIKLARSLAEDIGLDGAGGEGNP